MKTGGAPARMMLVCAVSALSACAGTAKPATKTAAVYGEVLSVHSAKKKDVSVTGGAFQGAWDLFSQGSMGTSTADVLAAATGAVIGGIGAHKEDSEVGFDYDIREDGGKVVSIVQYVDKDEKPLRAGTRVMITDAQGRNGAKRLCVSPLDGK